MYTIHIENLRASCSTKHNLLAAGPCPLVAINGDVMPANALLEHGLTVGGIGNFTFILKENTPEESVIETCRSPTTLHNAVVLVAYQQMYCFRPDPDIVAISTINTATGVEGKIIVGCTDTCPWQYSWNGYAKDSLTLCLAKAAPICQKILKYCIGDNFYKK